MIRVVACPRPFRDDRVEVEVPDGSTVTDCLRAAGLDPDGPAGVAVDGVPVPLNLRGTTHPASGAQVTARVVPTGERAKKVFSFLKYIHPASFIASLQIEALSGSSNAASLASLNRNRLRGRQYITGQRNEVRPYDRVPKVLGRVRVRPELAAIPYSVWEGKTQYYMMLFSFGRGPLELSDHRIGNTPASAYGLEEGVNLQVRRGWPDDPDVQHYLDKVREDILTVELRQVDEDGNDTPYSVRTSEVDVERLAVEVTLPKGLCEFNEKGEKVKLDVDIDVEYRAVGASTWSKAFGRGENGKLNSFSGFRLKEKDPSYMVRAIEWSVDRGQYEVRLRRTSKDFNSSKKLGETWWTMLRSFRLGNPINFPGLCTVSMRVRATGQLNGILDDYSALATWVGPYWDEDASAWITPTKSSDPPTEPWQYASPAAHLRAILCEEPYSLSTSRVDLSALEAWAEEIRAAGLYFNQQISDEASVYQRLQQVAAAGRASPNMRNGKWSVVSDLTARTAVVQHLTPRNSSNFSGHTTYEDPVHALEVEYVDGEGALATWKLVRTTVYDDGYSLDGSEAGTVTATNIERLELPYVTSAEEARKHGRYELARRRLRRDTYSLDVGIEGLVGSRGDLVLLGAEVFESAPSWGRVVSVEKNGSGACTKVTVDEALDVDSALSYRFRFRHNDGTSNDRNVSTPSPSGSYRTFTFNPAISSGSVHPATGELFLFGQTTVDWKRALISSIEYRDELTARLVLVDEAPGVYTADGTPGKSTKSPSSDGAPKNSLGEVGKNRQVIVVSKPAGDGKSDAGIVVKIPAPPPGRLPTGKVAQ